MRTLIIAEAGVNHNGSLERAHKLVEAAALAGVDIVKFQTFKAESLVSLSAKKAEYQTRNINDGDDSQYAMLKRLEMPESWHHELMAHCAEVGVRFLSTGFDEESVDLLHTLGSPLYKIPSGEITNRPYLEHIARLGRPVILSTGMATLDEVREAADVLYAAGLGRGELTVLHCNTEYPTPMADVNLRAMLQIRDELDVHVGYSDHTLGIEVPIAAVAMGAVVIEKHFTLDKGLPGPDHRASLEPHELTAMVKAIRNIEQALGSATKEPSPSELPNRAIARKSIHLRHALKSGQVIAMEDLIMLRPGDGLSPMRIDEVVGKKAQRDIVEGHKLSEADLS